MLLEEIRGIRYYWQFEHMIYEIFCMLIIYGTFLWYSIGILKIKKEIVCSILFLATISQKVWIFEVNKRDWTGLIWLKYFHIAFVVIYLLFIIWLLYIEYHVKNKIKTILIHLLFYSVILVVFIKYTTDNLFWALYVNSRFSYLIFILVCNITSEYYKYLYIGTIIFLEIIVIFSINIGIMFVEKKKFTKKIIGIILLPILFIPIYTAILTRNYGILDWEHWLKTGNIIFSVILYECTYITYIKTKYNNEIRDNGT
jgi:hypothetical protein